MKQQKTAACCRMLLCLVLAMLLCLCGCSAKQAPLSWQEQYDLGVRYLNEGNYEEAILAFEAAISIDPKRPEAYALLADAYLAAGDEAGAQDALERGTSATGDEGLSDRLEEMKPPVSESTPEPVPADSLFTGPFLGVEEVELLQLDLDAAAALVRADGLYDAEDVSHTESDDARYADIGIRTADVIYGVCNLEQLNDAAAVTRVHFYGSWDTGGNIPSPVHIRDIRLGDSREAVLTALGFTEADIAAVSNQMISITRLLGGDAATWEQLGLIPEGAATPEAQQTDLGIVGWVASLSPADEGSDGMVQLLYQNGTTGAYTNSVQFEFYNGILNEVNVYTA